MGIDVLKILRVTQRLKLVFVYIVNGPKILVLIGVAYVGAKFLLYSNNLSGLILKIPPLFFLAQLDNVVFVGLASAKFQNTVANSAFFFYAEKTPLHWNLWGATVTKSLVIALSSIWYARIHHARLQEWRDLCLAYEAVFLPECGHCGLHMFGTVFYH